MLNFYICIIHPTNVRNVILSSLSGLYYFCRILAFETFFVVNMLKKLKFSILMVIMMKNDEVFLSDIAPFSDL
jgi:hypothetical protein